MKHFACFAPPVFILFAWPPLYNPAFFAGLPPCTRFSLQGSHPATRSLQGFPPCTRRPLLKKGSIRKLFLWRETYFLWKGEEPGMPEQWISGNRSMDADRRPLCGCFVLSCMEGGIFRKPLGFRRCLPPARPEKAKPFQAGRSPCTKHPRFSGLAFTHRKKFLRVPRGVFSKTLLGREWDGVPQKESEPAIGARLVRRDKVLSRNTHRPSGLAFTLRKKFLRVPRDVFSKMRPWQGVGRSPT